MEIKVPQFSFKTTEIIKDVTLPLNSGDKISIHGKNGVGKSTLFNLIIGKYKSTIAIDETVEFGYFGKDANLNPESTLQREIDLFKNEIHLENYNHLKIGFSFEPFENVKIKNLSQGNKIKCELIFILSNINKKMFLLDEPTESLDEASVIYLGKIIRERKETFLVITHDAQFADSFSTRKYLFENKTLVPND